VDNIKWKEINSALDDVIQGLRGPPARAEQSQTPPADPCSNLENLPADYEQRVNRAFELAKGEFNKALYPLQKEINLFTKIVFPALGIAIALCVLAVGLSYYPIALGAGSFGGLGALYVCMLRVWKLGKDQALLVLIPSAYELQFSLALTPQQHCFILRAFMQETLAMRQTH
jgi:hypothetical protein